MHNECSHNVGQVNMSFNVKWWISASLLLLGAVCLVVGVILLIINQTNPDNVVYYIGLSLSGVALLLLMVGLLLRSYCGENEMRSFRC